MNPSHYIVVSFRDPFYPSWAIEREEFDEFSLESEVERIKQAWASFGGREFRVAVGEIKEITGPSSARYCRARSVCEFAIPGAPYWIGGPRAMAGQPDSPASIAAGQAEHWDRREPLLAGDDPI